MKLIQPTLQPGNQGNEIKNLHFILYFFRLRLNNEQVNGLMDDQGFHQDYKNEVFQILYDRATRKLVSVFQEVFQLHAEQGIVDPPTAEKFNQMLREFQGLEIEIPDHYPYEIDNRLAEEQRSFKVSGFVVNKKGSHISKQAVIAYDVDLVGVRILRDVNKLANLEETGGYERLGNAETNADGYYEISFDTAQYGKNELQLADVVVFAVDGEGKITGRSPLSVKNNYENGTELKNWNVILDDEKVQGVIEYKYIMSIVQPFMHQNGLELQQVFDSGDQVAFIANETEMPFEAILFLVQADKLRKDCEGDDLFHELFYGVGRQQILLDWMALAVINERELKRSIEQSISQSIISPISEENIHGFINKVRMVAVEKLLQENDQNKTAGLTKMLGISLTEQNLQKDFIEAYLKFDGDAPDFWNAIRQHDSFKDRPGLIKSMLLTSQLSRLTGNHVALVETLQVKKEVKSAIQLMDYTKEKWSEVLNESGWPEEVNPEDEESKNAYVENLQNLLHSAFPTEKIASMIRNNELKHDDASVNEAAIEFFNKAEGFDFASSRVTDFSEIIRSVSDGKEAEVTGFLQMLQRVFQVSPTPDTMQQLVKLNLTSAYQIANIPEQSFVQKYGEKLGEEMAHVVHARAVYQLGRVQDLAMRMYEHSHLSSPQLIS